MTAPTKQDAMTLLVFVVAGALALVVGAVALHLTLSILNLDLDQFIEIFLAIVAVVTGGGIGAASYKASLKSKGGD